MSAGFDPDAAASADSGIYGLSIEPENAAVIVVPVPFEATTSYGGGTSDGPAAVLEASRQVDLWDHDTGKPYEAGIAMLDLPREIVAWNEKARRLAGPIIEKGGLIDDDPDLQRDLAEVDSIGERVNEWVYEQTRFWIGKNRMPVVLGGDHSVPFGAMRAYAEAFPGLGVLHLDAHADLRESYEGFKWSHASIFFNVFREIPDVSRIVQVGLRDVGGAEAEMIVESGDRIRAWYDSDLASRAQAGELWSDMAAEIVDALPQQVYLSWDIDGLDPTLCPGTGTPVPGGLSWHQAIGLLSAVVRSGRRIVGLDLCEVSPGETEWDANVGARLLYKMIGYALLSQSSR